MTDRSFGLFEPDALLPAQFYAAFRGGSGVRGEKRLMLAVLEDALDCFQKDAVARDGHGQQLFDEAHQWIVSNDRGWFFSYENICETLEINPEYLRRGLQNWRSEVASGTRPPRNVPKAELQRLQAAVG
ncbi:MAG: hypothetical protein U0802_15400 [Candidatus Binatia bacterium]